MMFIGCGQSDAAKAVVFRGSSVDPVDRTTYTFISQAIGTAAADRYVIVAVKSTGGSAHTWVSGTIGGVAAALVTDGSTTAQQASGVATEFIMMALVPTGTTATISYTLSAAAGRSGIGIWSATGLVSAQANNVQLDTSNPGSISLNTLGGGFAIALAGTGGGGTTTWSNLTERYDEDAEPSGGSFQSGADAVTVGGSLVVTATRTASSAPILIGAAW